MIDSKTMLEVAVKAGDSKRAEDIVALDMRGVSLLACLLYTSPSPRD